LEELDTACQPLKLSYIRLDSGLVSGGGFEAYTRIIYSGGDGFYLNNIRFRAGGAWIAGRESGNAVVINDSLAWQLFGSLDAVDKAVNIAGELRMVAGLTVQERVSKDDCFAYLPFDPIPGHREISGIFLQTANYNKMSDCPIHTWLEVTGKDRRDYFVTDMNRYVENIAIKYRLLLLLIALYVIAALIINSYKLFKYNYARRKNPLRFAAMLFALAAADVFFIVILLNGLTFDIWIPHEAGGRLAALLKAVANSGVLPPREYLLENLQELARLNAFANTALISGMVALLNLIFVQGQAVSPKSEKIAYPPADGETSVISIPS
ncbi:MAG: ABC transporter permease, partial [Clostridiales bacterium]|nr:ABC transporter permease [Clostridiales bacterium]